MTDTGNSLKTYALQICHIRLYSILLMLPIVILLYLFDMVLALERLVGIGRSHAGLLKGF